jgi:LPPG:FO 2-phospho-L-lactate transferase
LPFSQKVVALAGGVGGAKFADGLSHLLPPDQLTIIVNTGDDFEHLGLRICPDLDTVCYTLAGMANPQTGWGLAGESFHALESLESLGGPGWFHVGDRDLGTHLERTRRLKVGQSLSQVTGAFCQTWQVRARVLPMTDDPAPTVVLTSEGELPFQEYFVHKQCRPTVMGFRFEGIEQALPAPGLLEALRMTDLVIFCPSNPWVSIDPILSVPGVRWTLLEERKRRGLSILAISPIIGGKTVKGPAAKMFSEMGITPSALAVAEHYKELCSLFVLDRLDEEQAQAIRVLGMQPLVADTLMNSSSDRVRLADEVLRFYEGRSA